MKRRLFLLTTSLFIIMLLFSVGIFYGESYLQRIFLATSIIAFTFLLIFIFFGMAKLVVTLIYGMVLALLLVILPDYDIALIFIGTFIYALNPLNDFEEFINKNLPEEKSILDYLKGSYLSYYNYRKEIKDYYHLPQVKKTFTKPWYLKVRQGLTILLSMLAIFLLIREVNNLISFIKTFDIHLFFASIYSVVVLISLTIMLYRKGFQTALNLLSVLVFPALAYSMFLIRPVYLGVIIGLIASFLGIAMAVYQYISYRMRIVFESFHYYDSEKQAEVYANALFEKYVYDESYHLATSFTIGIDHIDFLKVFQNIVVYADFRRFFITAYAVKKDQITIYTDFHENNYLGIDKFKKYLETMFNDDVMIKITEDKDKVFYENNFFHTDNYIVTRTVYLANVLKKINIKSDVVISFISYFDNFENVVNMSKKYNVIRLPELDLENVITTRVNIKVNNVDYIIENYVREYLLDLLIYSGKYVRVNVFYWFDK